MQIVDIINANKKEFVTRRNSKNRKINSEINWSTTHNQVKPVHVISSLIDQQKSRIFFEMIPIRFLTELQSIDISLIIYQIRALRIFIT